MRDLDPTLMVAEGSIGSSISWTEIFLGTNILVVKRYLTVDDGPLFLPCHAVSLNSCENHQHKKNPSTEMLAFGATFIFILARIVA